MKRFTYIFFLAALIVSSGFAETIEDYVSSDIVASKSEVYVGEPLEVRLTVRSHSVTLDQDFSIDPLKDPAIRKLPGDASQYPIERKVVGNRIEEYRRFSWNVVAVRPGSIDFSNTLELFVLSRNTSLFFSRPKRTPFSIPVTGSTVIVKPLPDSGRPENFA